MTVSTNTQVGICFISVAWFKGLTLSLTIFYWLTKNIKNAHIILEKWCGFMRRSMCKFLTHHTFWIDAIWYKHSWYSEDESYGLSDLTPIIMLTFVTARKVGFSSVIVTVKLLWKFKLTTTSRNLQSAQKTASNCQELMWIFSGSFKVRDPKTRPISA